MPNLGFNYQLIENYIYFYHTDTFIVLPQYPDNIQDSISVNFAQETILSRSAPIYSYTNSGPRSLNFQFIFHRDMMEEANYQVSNEILDNENNEDYIDVLVRKIQAAALPVYDSSKKLVDPPIIAVRIGNQFFIKGVVQGAVTVGYNLPLLDNGKYAVCSIGFSVAEIEPYDAEMVMQFGSFRPIDKTLESVEYKVLGR